MRCAVCNRPLVSAKSKLAGMGPVCARKFQAKELSKQDQSGVEIVPWNIGDDFFAEADDMVVRRTNIQQLDMMISPTGFAIGYGGSGPNCLAVNMVLMLAEINGDAYRVGSHFVENYICKNKNCVYMPFDQVVRDLIDLEIALKPEVFQFLDQKINTAP